MLPDTTKGATTIGRYHTIVPPINRPDSTMRPISSRSNSIMAETSIHLNLNTSDEYNHDDHAINSISEENDPSGMISLILLAHISKENYPSSRCDTACTQQTFRHVLPKTSLV